MEELSPLRRLGLASIAFALLAIGAPGLSGEDGTLAFAVLGIAVWGAVASRPGRRAVLCEWLPASAGMGAICAWMWYVVGAVTFYPALGLGAYIAGAGVLLRRLVHTSGVPLALAVPIAWVGVETLRTVVPPPFGLPWLRLGHYAHDHLALAGGARVVGVQGLSFFLALTAGGLAAIASARRLVPSGALAILLGLGGPALLGLVFGPPAERDGPRLLLVQPGIPQDVKKSAGTRDQLYDWGMRVTREGLDALDEPVDAVCWGETMLHLPLGVLSDELVEAVDGGLRDGPDIGAPWDPRTVSIVASHEEAAVGTPLFGRLDPESGERRGPALLPEGTSFLAGVIEYGLLEEEGARRIVRRNAAAVWDPRGERTSGVGKIHLVPAAESLWGFDRVVHENEWLEELVLAWIGYPPDLYPFEATGALPLRTRDGDEASVGITVCFDNAFVDPYVDAVRRLDVDLHLVLSNEAWYRESLEFDHMIAFSRLAAIATGRSVVRATNSGITCLVGPDGSERARLEVDGRDRAVEGTLAVTVPVPAEGAARTTPFARWREGWIGLWLLLPLAGLRKRRPAPGPDELPAQT